MKPLIMHFSPASCHFFSLGSRYSIKHPVLKLHRPIKLKVRSKKIGLSEVSGSHGGEYEDVKTSGI
jgi:hypothetical protein